MRVESLIKNGSPWTSRGKDAGIVMSSRVRLARNLHDTKFPGWADDTARSRVWAQLSRTVSRLKLMKNPVVFDMAGLSDVDKAVLKERRLISPELTECGKGSGVVYSAEEGLAVMVNEEDHLRIQAVARGLDLKGIWRKVDRLDSELEQHVDYAFRRKLGYLTACPTNVGTGLRTSVMLHLSGLKLMNEVEAVVNGLDKLGVTVRGILGEGSEAFGNMFQISNQSTLGETEDALIERLSEIVREVVEHERNARTRLLQKRPALVFDQIGRAYGVLTQSRILSSSEAVDLLSALRLGVDFGIVKRLTTNKINQIMLWTQPGHLQTFAGKALGELERDEVRSRFVREKLQNVKLGDEASL